MPLNRSKRCMSGGIGNKTREWTERDVLTMFYIAAATKATVAWRCCSARDNRDGAAVMIASATHHVLRP